MQSAHHFEMFSLVADVRVETSIPIHDYVPAVGLGFRRREIVMPAFIPAMVSGLRKFRPDIIHQHFGTWSAPATQAARRSQVPLVTTLHGADVFTLSSRPSTAMARWHRFNMAGTSRQSDRLLAVSEFLAGAAVSAGLPSKKLEVHYQGVDTDYFKPLDERLEETTREGLPVVLFVGGLSEGKGIRDLVMASQILSKTARHRLVIAGDGQLKAEVLQAAWQFPHIELVGSLNRHSVRDWMRSARVLVVPSREHRGAREAAGLVALEAAACGTPVVAYDSGGLREMMIPDSTGLLVQEGQLDELAQAIRAIIELPEHSYMGMGGTARKFVEVERSLSKSCRELGEHYADLTMRAS
ncbi:glycosyltransferase [Arthrobacter sp. JZ12]|uniref:glycosyltransferase n=1 Tax=Arthrobacter sp. JZ12 TaxID=2654190 RepID=UPI002B470F30|nr:glycosyltransferase [Arthrobacter sp. JZ12]